MNQYNDLMEDVTLEATLNLCNNISIAYQMKFLSNFKVQCSPDGASGNFTITVPSTYAQWFKQIQAICDSDNYSTSIEDGSLVIRSVPAISYVYLAFNGQFTVWMHEIFQRLNGSGGFDSLVKEYATSIQYERED